MSVERCDQHDLHYDTDLKLCCPLCEEEESDKIAKVLMKKAAKRKVKRC
jgi:hypothetical protein